MDNGFPFGSKSCLSSLLAAGILLTACDELSSEVSQKWNHGTTYAVWKCVKRNKGQLVSDNVIRALCADEHSVPVYGGLTGRAGYGPRPFSFGKKKTSGTPAKYFSGHVENTTRDFVITSFTIVATHDENVDEEGNKVPERWTVHDVWVQPGEEKSFEFEDLKFRPILKPIDLDKNGEEANPFVWDVTNVMAVRISVD